MPTRDVTFVLPADHELVSGGNVYNRELLAALAALRSAGEDTPALKTLEPAAFREAVTSGAPGLYFLDTLNLADAPLLAQKTQGQRSVLVVHHLPSLEPGALASDADVTLERAVLPLFDAFLATSPFTVAELERRGVRREQVLLVEPGLPAVKPGALAGPQSALVAGNVIPRKGVRELLRALATRVRDSDDFHLDIVGRLELDATYASEVVRLAATPPLAGRVTLHAPVPYDAMGGFYRRAGVVLSAAAMETFGMALAEARAHGLPIFALDAGHAARHFDDGVDGRAFGSVEALAAGWLAALRDERSFAPIAENASRRASAGPATWDRAARRFVRELARLEALG
jgi:glycosyltransferase involved in cell wall biosynthesis